MYVRMAALALGLSLALPQAAAREVEGIALPEQVTLQGDALVLNGAGVRRYFLFKVYVGALYLEERAATPRAIIGAPEAKCIHLYFLRDVRAETIVKALLDGVRANVGDAGYARLRDRIERLRRVVPDLHAGDRVRLALPRPDHTQAWVNDVLVADVRGRDFHAAVLSFWLGDYPVDESLKQAMLGR